MLWRGIGSPDGENFNYALQWSCHNACDIDRHAEDYVYECGCISFYT